MVTTVTGARGPAGVPRFGDVQSDETADRISAVQKTERPLNAVRLRDGSTDSPETLTDTRTTRALRCVVDVRTASPRRTSGPCGTGCEPPLAAHDEAPGWVDHQWLSDMPLLRYVDVMVSSLSAQL